MKTQLGFTRRQALLTGSLGLLGAMGVSSRRVCAAADGDSPAPLNRFPHLVHEYFVSRVRRIEEEQNAIRASLKTKDDATRYVASVRERIQQAFGPLPEKTPLNAKVAGVVERDAYHIEKVIFESRPGFLVTANLYLPQGRKLPLPGVVGTCGHSANGKAAEAYQSFAQGLARQGYAVLIFDPIGQGERLQYTGDDLQSTLGAGVREHLKAGNQQYLVGESLTAWRAWDGIRALDYLLSREEVDPRHVGVTGNSGGGTATTWLCGIEPRWTMAAPSCFVTTFRRNLENELPADTEQCPPRALALGLDHSDFLAAMAPKPVIILAKEKDYFDVRGAIEAHERLRRLYGLLGAEENVSLFIGPSYHGYSQENREAMYRWFNRCTAASDRQTEPALTIEPDETLWCLPKGQVAALGSRTIFSFTADRAKALAERRESPAGKRLKQAVAESVRYTPQEAPPAYRILRPLRSRGYPRPHAVQYAVETEAGMLALVSRLYDERHYSRPPETERPAVLYVSHHSADAELRGEPLVAELIETNAGADFYACDVRGIGETRPDTCGDDTFLSPYGSDYFYAAHSIMLDDSYLAQKTRDVLRVIDWLADVGHVSVHLAAMGWGAIPAALAAVIHDRVNQVTLKHALTSYDELARAREYDWPLSALLPDVLARFDLPDCYRELAKGKNLRRIEPRGPAAESAAP